MADTLSSARGFIEKSNPSFIFSRTRLPGFKVESLLSLSAEAMGDFPPIIAFAEQGSADEARRLLELGAQDYWLEPLEWDKIGALLNGSEPETKSNPAPDSAPCGPSTPSAERQAANSLIQTRGGGGSIIGEHPAMKRVLALAKQVAPSKATVLISGPSGTGKEKFARFVHTHSDRAQKPFVAVNCAALPEHLLESELFGHEKGAFTGAINRKLGKFELAGGGTILLDEISEMELGLQAKLLRVLQEGEIDRVGGVETVKVDVRVLATTNRDIEGAVHEGTFRQDLFYRLNVIPLKLPALAERGDDVLLLADFFVGNFCKAYGLAPLGFSDDARQWLRSYNWPGNVRELQNLMERAVLLAGSGPIERAHFLLEGTEWQPDSATDAGPSASSPAAPTASATPAHDPDFDQILSLGEMEKRLILKSLDQTEGNRTKAASLLGISVRTLRNKLNDYKKQGLDIP